MNSVRVLIPHRHVAFELVQGELKGFSWHIGQEVKPGQMILLFPNTVLIQGEKNILVDPGVFHIGRLPVVALAWLGLGPGDIDFVVNTHLHVDHAGANTFFKKRPLVFHQGELEAHPETWIRYITDGMELRVFKGEKMLLAPGVELHHCPGHTPGSLCVLVRTADQNILITGDATGPGLARLVTKLKPHLIIPGHLDPGSPEDLMAKMA